MSRVVVPLVTTTLAQLTEVGIEVNMPILRQPMLVKSVSAGTVTVNVVAEAVIDSALTILQLQQLQAII